MLKAVSNVLSVPVTVQATVAIDAARLRSAIKRVLLHLQRGPALSLTVDIPVGLHTAAESALTVPAKLRVQEDPGGALSLRLAAEGRRYRGFPSFWGTLTIAISGERSSLVTLHGTYTVPSAPTGDGMDKTFLRRAAHSVLRAFLEDVIQETTRLTLA